MTTVLGIDPGTHRLGWGILTGNQNNQTYLASGCIESKSGTSSEVYLPYIEQKLIDILNKYHPSHLALESLLFNRNISTALPVAEVRGVIKLLATHAKIPFYEFAPNTIKLAVAGVGSAGKNEVTRMVGLLLHIKTEGKLDDELDALAVGLTALVLNKNK